MVPERKKKPLWILVVEICSLIGAIYAVLGIPTIREKFFPSSFTTPISSTGTTQNNQTAPQQIPTVNPSETHAQASPQKQPQTQQQQPPTQPQANPHVAPLQPAVINIGDYINNTSLTGDLAILIIDEEKKVVNDLSGEVAKLYRKAGLTVCNSYFTETFVRSPLLEKIEGGNADVIRSLALPQHIKYLFIGRYAHKFGDGRPYGKYLCASSLDVKIISCTRCTQADVFAVPGSCPFDDEVHAEHGAKNKLLLSLEEDHIKNSNQIEL